MNRATLAVPLLLLAACNRAVNSDAEAEVAAVGLEGAIERALDLGLQGFNAASSANIPEQSGPGDVSGTMTVNGQADQGASANKGLRLDVALEDYADLETVDNDELDSVQVAYDTDASDLPYFNLSLRDIPDGTIEGTITGVFLLSGDLEGSVSLDLQLDGFIVSDGNGGTMREEGTTVLTGTATNPGGGSFDVDVTI